MLELLASKWWTFIVRGILAILFGILALFWPGVTLTALIIAFGAYAIVDGIMAIVAAISGVTNQRWWALVLWGVLGIAAGVVAFVYPGLTALVLLYVIAFWAIVRGVMEIIAAIQLRKVLSNEWLLILAGAFWIIFGGVVLARPHVGALAVLWLIGTVAIIAGFLLIGLGARLKSVKNRLGDEQRGFA